MQWRNIVQHIRKCQFYRIFVVSHVQDIANYMLAIGALNFLPYATLDGLNNREN